MKDRERLFRDAVGKFATGVTVVTGCDTDGRPVGMTANSFVSLSLNPQLVSFNVGNKSDCFDVFCRSDHFAIHILHGEQEHLSQHFAQPSLDKFENLKWHKGECGSPILEDYAVCIECRKEAEYPGGDHLIMVGRVIKLDDRGNSDPLIFHGGQYRRLA